ncbi:MAG: spondin domain-containing protein [Gemmatimonadota bacterium]|nr:spondin domain-containing protein [Gemmatimonadota bacterium]
MRSTTGRWLVGILTLVLTTSPILLQACDDDDGTAPPMSTRFRLRVENVSTVFPFLKSGVFATPVGAADPGPLLPGSAYEFDFTAPPGMRLSFATMFVPSNDFFYGPSEEGIPLYDDGTPIQGDITDRILLWDAGTEVNQEPGLGADQPMRQAGPDTGADDPNSAVRIAPDDFGNLPAVADVIEVTITPGANGRFTVRIENVSTPNTLMTSDGGSQPVPLAPGVFVVHAMDAPLFTEGAADPGEGLEALAEDGVAGPLGMSLAERTGLTSPLAPGVFVVHDEPAPLFTTGQPDRGEGLEALAEDGVPSMLANSFTADEVGASGAFTTPVGANGPAPAFPGQAYEVEFDAVPGQALSLATMLVQSNDLFYAPGEAGIPLFVGDDPVSGEVTDQILLWDAGTEVNQEPGVGFDQAPRQAGPDTGPEENAPVRTISMVNDGYDYPAVEDVIRVTVDPMMP